MSEDQVISPSVGIEVVSGTPIVARHRSRTKVRLWLRTIAIGICLLVFSAWLVLFVTKGRFLKGTFESVATSLLHRQAYDFVEGRAHDGRKFRILTIIDEASRECLALVVARQLKHEDVLAALADLFITRGVDWRRKRDPGSSSLSY